MDVDSTASFIVLGNGPSPDLQLVRAERFLEAMKADYEAITGHPAPRCDNSAASAFFEQDRARHPFYYSDWSPWYDIDEDKERIKKYWEAWNEQAKRGRLCKMSFRKETRASYRKHKMNLELEHQALLIAVAEERIKKRRAQLLTQQEQPGSSNSLISILANHQEIQKSKETTIGDAIVREDVVKLRQLLSRFPVNGFLSDTVTPLYLAAVVDSAPVVGLLLGRGADPNISKHWRPLAAALENDNLQVVEMLIQKGAVPRGRFGFESALNQARSVQVAGYLVETLNPSTDELNAALHDYSFQGNLEMVRFLLNHGAEVDCPDEHDLRPLFRVALRGYTEVTRCLLDRGADIHGADSRGGYLGVAVEGWHEHTVVLLLQYSAEVNAFDEKGQTPLIKAAGRGMASIARILLDHGAEIEAVARQGVRAIHAAVKSGDLDLVQELLRRGANPNTHLTDGRTSLHIAVETGQIAMAKLLLSHGADPGAREGRTARQLALGNGQAHMATILPVTDASEAEVDEILSRQSDESDGFSQSSTDSSHVDVSYPVAAKAPGLWRRFLSRLQRGTKQKAL